MYTYVTIGLMFLVLIGVSGYIYYKDRKYIRSKTSEVMSERVRKELLSERDALLMRRADFKRVLDETKKKS